MPSLIDELLYFYYNYDNFQTSYFDKEKAIRYFKTIIDKNCICTTLNDDGKLIGYVEFWRINYEQFGRILCCEPINIYDEDIENGPICYLANITVHPDFRRGRTIIDLRGKFFRENYYSKYFVGHAKRKKTQPVKVFTRQEAFMKWIPNTEAKKWVDQEKAQQL